MGSELNLSTTDSRIVSKTWVGNILSFVWNWTAGWFSWTRQSDEMLRNVEKKILSCIKTAYKRFYVDIGSVVGQCDKIWTISLNDESSKTPLVLLHGMGAGVALWCPNLDALAATRPVYAIDLLGFGRSSRPKFSCDAVKAEAQWVESVEEWRREVNLPQFVLLGHSLGGYIATAYAIKYPERVRHLVLADPWGFPERPDNPYERHQLPLWVRAVATAVQPLNPLWAVRAAGPAGRWLVSKTRPDISRKYLTYIPEAETVIPEYIYQCNSQTPSGEGAFHTLMTGFGWAKNPMVKRLNQLHPELPITMLYGSRSWVDNCTGQVLSESRPSSFTHIQVINGAGHHVYLDKPDLFNKYVLEACSKADDMENKPQRSNPTNENGRIEQPANESARSNQPANGDARLNQPTNGDARVDQSTNNNSEGSRNNQSQALPS